MQKILAKRLSKVIPTLVHMEQVGSFPNASPRTAQDALLILRGQYAMATLPLDTEKAFDRIEWQYPFLTLKHFRFGVKFIN